MNHSCLLGSKMALAAPSFLLVAFACTNVELCALPCAGIDLPPPDNVIRIEGAACTVEPDAVLYPYKVLFVIDVSGSNQMSDPADNRARAVERVIEEYVENRSVAFAVMTFNQTASLETPRFTRDRDVLVPEAIDALRVKDGGTNYLDPLAAALQFIEADILATPEGERARTRYDIQWLSDGIPDPCQRPAAIVGMADALAQLRERYGLFDLVINTTRLLYPGERYDVEGCNDLLPRDYLEPMARTGHGTYQELTSGELAFEIGFTEILRAFEHRSFFVVNESRTIWEDSPVADSDRDGLADMDFGFEPDPLAADADEDGCSDRVDQEMLPNVGLCSATCLREREERGFLEDLDGDGIPDCAEKVLGYHRTRADSDLDGFPDLLELKMHTNPLAGDIFENDSDGDGLSDGDELRLGTSPTWPESETLRPLASYAYGPLHPLQSQTRGSSCFRFRVDNMRIVETQATRDTRTGDNVICVYIVQTPLDDPSAQPTVTKACKTARYGWAGEFEVKEPANGILPFEATDFVMDMTGSVSSTVAGGVQ